MRSGPTAGALPVSVLVLAALTTAFPAFAAQPQSRPPPEVPPGEKDLRGAAIPYYNAAPRSSELVRRAVRAWNRALVGTHFVAVARRDARVVIRAAPARERCNGLANIRNSQASRTRDTPIRYGFGRSAVVTLGEDCPLPAVRAFVAAHELGHVLGLNHERRRCSVMSPKAEFTSETVKPFPGCSAGAWAKLRRDLVADTDVRAARSLYNREFPKTHVPLSPPDEPSLGPMGWAALGLVGAAVVAGLTQLRRR